ncbi:MAG: hypothetical protein HYS60_00085 [Candidatus Wildermuthbacteria bacterium]|nr:hypothetical protein [Candidatus Wildermuthbacteria bacterium]
MKNERITGKTNFDIGKFAAEMFLFSLLVLLVTGITIYFPREKLITRQYPLISGDQVLVSSVLNGDVEVKVDQFLKLAEGHPIFIAPAYSKIEYLVKVDGVSYRYNQHTDGPGFPRYVEIQERAQMVNGILVREFHTEANSMIIFLVIMPGIVVVLLVWAIVQVNSFRRW